jgi:hypothetical protein
MAADHGEIGPLYDGSIYERRRDIEDARQREHLRRSTWLKPGDCTCRTDARGRPWYVCVNAHCQRAAKACGGYCVVCFQRHGQNVDVLASIPTLDFHHLAHQREWSDATFGPGRRQAGVIDHIRKELQEVIDSGGDVAEWADVIILALDGATRAAIEDGGTVADVLVAVADKQAHNEAREWPDWRTQPTDRAIEHVRTEASLSGSDREGDR